MEYFIERGLQLIFVIAQNMVNHALILKMIFTLMDFKLPTKKILLSSSVVTVLYLFPIYLFDFIFFGPTSLFPKWLYCMLIFVQPIQGVLYYFALKQIMAFSATRACTVMQLHLVIHYMIVLFYMLLNDIYIRLWGVEEVLKTFYLGDVICILLVIGALFIIYCTLKYILRKKRCYLLLPPNYAEENVQGNILHTLCALGIIYIASEFALVYVYPSVNQPITGLSTFLYLNLIICIFLYLYSTILRIRTRVLEWEMQATDTYLSSLLSINQEFRGVKHDFNNILQGYGGFLEIGDYSGLEHYHEQVVQTVKHTGDFLSILDVLRPRIAIYSLLAGACERAQQARINFSVNLICDVSQVVLSDVDFCRILGITLDNAIEAAHGSNERQVTISFEQKNSRTIVIAISNTTRDDVDVARVLEEGYTTKPAHAGIGLSQVQHILNRYELCFLRVCYHENQFTVFLILDADE